MRGKTNLTQTLNLLTINFPLHDLIISPHVKHSSINLLKIFYSVMQNFFTKKSSPVLCSGGVGREETLCFIFKSFPISKISSLTFVVPTLTFQTKLPSHCFKAIQYGFEIFKTVLSLNCKII